MKVNDYRFWKGRIETAPANSRGAFDQFVQDQRPMAQEPRNMFADGQLVRPNDDGSRPGYSGEYGKNIRLSTTGADTFEVQVVRGGTTGGKKGEGQRFYKNFKFDDYGGKEAALKAAKEYRNSVKNIPKKTGTVMTEKRLELAAKRKGTVSETGKKAEIRNALKNIIKVGGKSFSNEDLRKLVDISLFDTDDYFRKTVDVVKKEPAFKNLTFEKKPRVRLKNDPVSVLQAAASERRKKKLDILGSKEYEKELYKYKKEIQEGLGLEKYKTSGSISGKPKEILPIEMGHQSSIKQLSLLKQKMRPEDLSPQNYEVNRKGVQKNKGGVQTLENNLNRNFYPAQKKLYIQAKKFIDAGKTVPADLQNKIVSLNEDIQKFVDKTVKQYPLLKDRVNPITIDANDLTVKRGNNVFKQLGIGLVDQNLGDIKIGSIDDLTIKANLAEQTLKEAVDAGLIDEVEGQKKLNKFLNAKPIEDITQDLGTLGCPKGLPAASGGRIKFDKGGACVLKGKEKLRLGLTNGFDKTEGELAKKILQAGKGLKNLASLKGLLGPAGLAFEVAVSAGLVGYDMLATGKSFKEAVGASLFNYALGDKTQIDNKKLRYQGYKDAGVDENQIGKISAFENAMDEMNNLSAEFNEENRLYNIATNQKGRGRMDPKRYEKTKQQQIENFYNQADKNKALIQDLARTQTEDRLDKALDPMVPAIMSDADAKRKAMQMTKPSTVGFGNVMDTIFPSGFFSGTTYEEDRDKAVNYMPEVQEYYRGNRFAKGGLSGGDTSGRPPESGPMSQGLRSLYKNGRKL
mgnify:CR=1 FL=1